MKDKSEVVLKTRNKESISFLVQKATIDDSQTCHNCKFYHYTTKISDVNGVLALDISECRRYAPRMVCGVGVNWTKWAWPKVQPCDWCGEFKLFKNNEKCKNYSDIEDVGERLESLSKALGDKGIDCASDIGLLRNNRSVI